MTTDDNNDPRSLADQVANLAKGQWAKLDTANAWTDVAVTRDEHDQMVANGSEPFWGWGGPQIVFRSWNSAAFDAQDDRMFFMGGGRTNYGGNEVYQFDFDTLEWSRVTDPSPLTVKDWDDPDVDGPSEKDVYIPEGAPNTAHTYDSLNWNPVTESFWYTATRIGFDDSNGDSMPRNPSVQAVWELDPATGEWTQHDASVNPRRGASTVLEDTGQILSLHNESSHDVFAFLYDPDGTEHALGQVERENGDALRIGTDVFSNPETGEHFVAGDGGFHRLNITQDSVTTTLVSRFPSVEDLGVSFAFTQAGYAYRPEDQKFYIWNGGPRVARWDPETGETELLWNEDAPEAPPEASDVSGRAFQKWAYLEEADAFAGVGEKGETFLWRPGDNSPDINQAELGELRLDAQTTGTLGVFLPLLGGEKNQNSEVSLAYRERGASTWRDGQDLLRMRPELNDIENPSPNGYAGALHGLDPGTTYEIRIEATDPDGVTGTATQTITASTATPPADAPRNANVIAVDDVAAVRDALDGAQAGDVIELQPGTYNLDDVLRLSAQGTADDPVVLRGADRANTVIDAQGGRGLFVGGDNVIVEDLTIDNARTGIRVTHGNDITLRGNHLSIVDPDNKAHKGIIGTAENLRIVDNVLDGPFPFGRIDNAGGGRGIDVGGQDVEIAYNTLSGFLDSIAGGRDGTVGLEIHHNKVLWSTDNAIELDGGLRNLSAHDNLLLNSSDAISAQPVKGGPAYIFDNVLHNVEGTPFKFKPTDASPQGMVVVNNTVTKAGAAWINDSGTPSQMTVANNLFAAQGTTNGATLRNLSDHRLLEMDNNAWLTDGDFRLDRAGKTDISVDGFAEWRDTTPFGNNSLLLENDPVFRDLNLDFDVNDFFTFRNGDANFNLDPDSPAVDAGKVFPTINDDFDGEAPDIGAFETGSAMPDYGARIDHPSPLKPTAGDDTAVGEINTSMTIDVLANDFDVNGGTLAIADVGSPEHGSVSINADGTITYTPTNDFAGADSFTYTITDNQDGATNATVSVTTIDGTIIDPNNAVLVLQSDVLAASHADGERIAAWTDTSSAGNVIQQTNTGRQPTLLEAGDASAVHFDGNDDALRIANSESLNTGESYDAKTLSIAFRTGADVGGRQVIYEQGGAARGINIYLEDGQVHASAWNLAETEWGPLTLSGDVSAGTNHTITLGLDADAGTLTAHLDGTSLGTKNGAGTLHTHANDIALGAAAGDTLFGTETVRDNGTYNHFGGDILDAAFTNTVLSDAQRTDLESQLGGDAGSLPPPDSNSAPIAEADTATTVEGASVTIDVLANDGDPDGDSLTVTGVDGAANGAASVNADGTVTYTPDSGFVGDDGLTYTVSDGNGGTDTGSVAVSVNSDTQSGGSGGDTSGSSSVVQRLDARTLADRLADGDAVSQWRDQALANDASQATGSRQPSLVDGDNGPAVAFDGEDDVLRLDNGDSLNVGGPYDAKTLTIGFRPGDDVDSRQVIYEQGGAAQGMNIYIENGRVHAGAWNTADGSWGPFTVRGDIAPGQVHTVSLVLDGTAGTVAAYLDGTLAGSAEGAAPLSSHANPSALGAVAEHTMFADGGFQSEATAHHFAGDILGTRFFNAALDDSARTAAESALAEPNTAPTAEPDSATTQRDNPVTIDVLANDGDPDGDGLTVTRVDGAANGAASVNADGTVTYTPDSGFVGDDGLTYTVSDGNGGTDTGSVAVSVNSDTQSGGSGGDTSGSSSVVQRLDARTLADRLADGDAVSQWRDQALANDASQATGSRQPSLVDGDNGPAVAFDGRDDMLRFDNSESLNVGGPYDAKTLALSFRPGNDLDSRQVIYEQGGAAQGMNIYIENGQVHASAWNTADGSWGPFTLSGDVTAGATHTITLALDASRGALTANLDGTNLGTVEGAGALADHANPSALGAVNEHTRFGTEAVTQDEPTFHYEGAILDMVSYNASLEHSVAVQGLKDDVNDFTG